MKNVISETALINQTVISLRSKLFFEGTLFVVDENNVLKGSLTLNEFNKSGLDVQLIPFNKFPKYVNSGGVNCCPKAEADEIFSQYANIREIPVVDDDKKIVEIIYKEDESTIPYFKLPFTMEEINSVFEKYGSSNGWHHRMYLNDQANATEARKYILNYISRNFSKDDKILDVACGAGQLSFYLAELGFNNIHAFDYDEKLISIARDLGKLKNLNVDFTVGDAFNPKIDLQTVDVAVFLGWIGCCQGFLDGAKDKTIPQIICELFSRYNFSQGTTVFLDVYDDLSNYNIHKHKITHPNSNAIYPTACYDELKPVFETGGYELIDRCYDIHSRKNAIKMIYVLRKR